MAALKDLAESRGTLMNFDPRKLKVKAGLNTRDVRTADNREHIEWLAVSIAAIGVQKPLVIFLEGDEAFVSDGHCRLEATLLAIERGALIETVPCVPEPRGTNDVDRVLSQVVHNSGKPLTPLELGANFRRAMQMGATVDRISNMVGKSPSWINQMLDFQSAPEEVKQLVTSGAVSASLAAKVHKERGGDAANVLKEAIEKAKSNGQSRATERHVEPKDLPWARLQKWVRQAKRPAGVSDQDIYEALSILGEP